MSEKKLDIQKVEQILKKERGSWFNLMEPLKIIREVIKEIKSPDKLLKNTDKNLPRRTVQKGLSVSNVDINLGSGTESVSVSTKSVKAMNSITTLNRSKPIQPEKKSTLDIESIPYATEKDTGIPEGYSIFTGLNKPQK